MDGKIGTASNRWTTRPATCTGSVRAGVGSTGARPALSSPTSHELWVEPALPKALDGLSVKQRTAVVLVHCFAWTYDEVGEVLGVGKTTVQNHVERGMAKLRAALEVDSDD